LCSESAATRPTRSNSGVAPQVATTTGLWGELEDAPATANRAPRRAAPPAALQPGASAAPASGSRPSRQSRQPAALSSARAPRRPHRQRASWPEEAGAETDEAIARLLHQQEEEELNARLKELEHNAAGPSALGMPPPRGWGGRRREPRDRPRAGAGANAGSAAAAAGAAAEARARGDPPPALSLHQATAGPRGAGRRWASPASFADMMAELLSAGPGGRAGGGRGGAAPPALSGAYAAIFGELSALHHAVSGARNNALPPDLLWSDRDFSEEDYEALLALDEGVKSRKGATQASIDRSIPVVRVPRGAAAAAAAAAAGDGDHGDQLPGDCTICLEACRGGENLRRLPCKHCFHKQCIDRWLHTKAACPICLRPAL
jgi:hypothetical protein